MVIEYCQSNHIIAFSLELLVIEIYTFPLVYPLHVYFSEIFYLIFKVIITISSMRKSNYLCFYHMIKESYSSNHLIPI